MNSVTNGDRLTRFNKVTTVSGVVAGVAGVGMVGETRGLDNTKGSWRHKGSASPLTRP